MIVNTKKIQFKRGEKKDLPILDLGEPAVTTDEKKLYVGTGTGNIEIASIDDIKGVSKEVFDFKEEATDQLLRKAENSKVQILSDQKADITYVDTKVGQIVSGSPKEVYNTLAELNSAYPNGTSGVFIVEGDWYYWKSNEWIKGGVYQGTVIPDKAVTVDKTSFILNNDLIDKSKIRSGGYYNKDSKGWTNNSNTSSSGLIPVDSGDEIKLILKDDTGSHHVTFVDSTNQIFTGFTVNSSEGFKDFIVPEGGAIGMYVAFHNDDLEMDRYRIFNLSKLKIDENIQISPKNIGRKTIDRSHVNFKIVDDVIDNVKTVNLFDPTNFIDGGFYGSKGWQSSSSVATFEMEVREYDTLRFVFDDGGHYIRFWDSVGKDISTTIYSSEELTLTAPKGTAKMSLAFRKSEVETLVITKNNPLPTEYIGHETNKLSPRIKVNGDNMPDGSLTPEKLSFPIVELDHQYGAINIFDKQNHLGIENGYYRSDFTWVDSNSIKTLKPYPINSGDVIRIQVEDDGNHIVVFKNSDGEMFASDGLQNGNSVTAPEGAVEMIIAYHHNDEEINNMMITVNQPIPSKYTPYNSKVLKSDVMISNESIQRESITKDKVLFKTIEDYYIESEDFINLYNEDYATNDGYHYYQPPFNKVEGHGMTGWISVKEGDVIRVSTPKDSDGAGHHITFKNKSGDIFDGLMIETNMGALKFIVPKEAISMSVALHSSEIYDGGVMITKNRELPETFIPHGVKSYIEPSFKNAIAQAVGDIGGGNGINNYYGKYVSFMGDSITTFNGWIPDGNAVYYPRGNVDSPDKTWWKMLIDQTGMNLCVNNSWSGSRVTTTSGDAQAGSMTRATSLHTLEKDPDVIIIYLGINDFNTNTSMGSYAGFGDFPTTTTSFREAYAIMLDKIMERYKHAEIFCCTLPFSRSDSIPRRNTNDVNLKDWNRAIREMAEIFGANLIEFDKSGMTHKNLAEYTIDDLHPNSRGMKLLTNKAIKTIVPTVGLV